MRMRSFIDNVDDILHIGLQATVQDAHLVASLVPCDGLGEVTTGGNGLADGSDVRGVLRVNVKQLDGVRAGVDDRQTASSLVDLDWALREKRAEVWWLTLSANTVGRDGFDIGLHGIHQRTRLAIVL